MSFFAQFSKAIAALASSGAGSLLGFGASAIFHVPTATTSAVVGVVATVIGGLGTYLAPANSTPPIPTKGS